MTTLRLTLLLDHSAALRAQIRQHSFGRVTTDDGLSSYRVYDVAQDSQGFLWIGTLEGLNRYDGHGFKVYRNDRLDSTSLSDNSARSLLVDRSGILWVGTNDGGLNKFDNETERFTRFINEPNNSKTIAQGRITSILEDRTGTLWVGTLGGGLDRFDKERGEFIHYRNDPLNPNSLCNDRVNTVFEDHEARLWIGTEGGISVLETSSGRFIHYFHHSNILNSLSRNLVRCIYQDAEGIFWIATQGGGLNRFDDKRRLFKHYRYSSSDPSSINNDDVSCIFQNDPRYIWVGTSDNDGGLARFDTKTERFTRFKNDPLNTKSLLHNYIRAIHEDKSGVMWIVTDRGLAKFHMRTERFQHYHIDPNPISSQVVSAVCESRDGTIWIGTDGLRGIDPTTNTTLYQFKHNPLKPTSLRPGFVQALYADRQGNVWAGTMDGGLECVNPINGKVTHYDLGVKTQVQYVHSILEDEIGSLWIGTSGAGLVGFDRKANQFTVYKNAPANQRSLSHNAVFPLLEDRAGVLWIGTEGGGLNRFNRATQEFISFKHNPADKNSLSNDNVYSLCEDARGRIWLATGNGLNMFNRETETFTSYSPSSPSQTGIIARIVEDNRGRLWLSTIQNGLFVFDPEKRSFDHFDAHDGLQSNRFWYAGFKRANGEIIFGGENGFNVFHPDSIRINTHIPSVVLTSFNIFQKPAQLSSPLSHLKEIKLAYNQNFFSFEFAALDFAVPARNQYAYRLEGVDTAWVYPEKERFAPYTKVDPGEYTFRVKGSNNDGLWNEVGLSIPITITPPYWATWWFRSLMAVLLVGILTAAYKYRIAKLLEMERMRIRIASDLHDDIGSSLGTIALMSDIIQQRVQLPDNERQEIINIGQNARKTASALRDIVFVINPESDSMNNLVLRMKDAATEMLANMQVTFNAHSSITNVKDLAFRRNLILIYKEMLHNVQKHSHATQVHIDLEDNAGMLTLRMKDNGKGFDEATVRRGHGLNSMQYRAEEIGGVLTVLSKAGQGTKSTLEVRIP